MKLCKIGLLLVLLCTILCCVIGCVQEKELTLTEIEKLMFADLESVTAVEGFPGKINELNDEQINILRTAIRNGKGLVGIEDTDPPGYDQNGVIEYKIDKVDRQEINLIYNRIDHYCYISKINVNYKQESVYMRQKGLINKYLNGIYKFRPSDDIQKLL